MLSWVNSRWMASPFPRGSFSVSGLYVCASAPQGLCLKLQKEKQTLQADIGQLRSSTADLKEWVQTLQERERLLASPKLNPLPTAIQSRNTSFGKAMTCNAHSGWLAGLLHVCCYINNYNQSINNWFYGFISPVVLFIHWFVATVHWSM